MGRYGNTVRETVLRRLILNVAVCCSLHSSDARAQEFAKVLASFGNLSTVAGTAQVDGGGDNGWQASMENGLATNAELSRPHMAMSDVAGIIYIADKDAHAIRRINLDGNIETVAGTNNAGFNGDGMGTLTQLNEPNGLFTFADGTNFILDLGNNRVRRLSADGNVDTVFADPAGVVIGRGLWVSADEDLIYYSSADSVKQWTPDGGISVVAAGFTNLGNITVDPFDGQLVVTDRGTRNVDDGSGHIVFKVDELGTKMPIAGSGATTGGASGDSALAVALHEVRAVTYDTNGGFYVGTHRDSDIWYVDTAGKIHLMIAGNRDNSTHAGDGQPLSAAGDKISEPRSVTIGANRELLIVENDGGYVRRVPRTLNVLGDYDYDGQLTGHDIDLLSRVVQYATHPASFNLNADDSRYVDAEDRQIWVEELAASLLGDANLDGKVDFGDFLKLSGAFGKHGGWEDGDTDGTGAIDFADFLNLSANFGRSSAVAIPEPSTQVWMITLVILGIRRWLLPTSRTSRGVT